ncbi:MAG: 3'-5' exonuclease [Nanobdellota archaeon]
MAYVITDIETTGLSKNSDKITEIACAKVDGGKIIDKFHTLVNPGVKIPSFITNLTGIDNEMVKDAPLIKDVIPFLKDFIGDDIFVAHNASFDFGFLQHNSRFYHGIDLKNDKLCTRKLANRLLPDLYSKRLSALCNHFGIVNSEAHRAMSDVYATVKVLKELLTILEYHDIKEEKDVLRFENMPRKKCLVSLNR